jgi:hypothetical protein
LELSEHPSTKASARQAEATPPGTTRSLVQWLLARSTQVNSQRPIPGVEFSGLYGLGLVSGAIARLIIAEREILQVLAQCLAHENRTTHSLPPGCFVGGLEQTPVDNDLNAPHAELIFTMPARQVSAL